MNNPVKLDKALQILYEFLESNSPDKKEELAFKFEEVVVDHGVIIPDEEKKEVILNKLEDTLVVEFAYYTDDPIARTQWSGYYSGKEMKEIIVKILRELSYLGVENIPEKYLQ